MALRLGLIPAWADDPRIGHRLINARAETAATKPSFRSAFRSRRCLIPADGYFEWQQRDGKKQPFYFHRRDGRPFAFAGLWGRWEPLSGGAIESCTILTTEANDLARPVHDRMPVIVAPADFARWLDPAAKPGPLQALLRPYPADEMEAYPVTTFVNNPKNEGPKCVEAMA